MAHFFQETAALPAEICSYLGAFDAAFCFSRSEALVHNLRRAGIRQTLTLSPFPDKRMHVIDHHLSSLKVLGIAAAPTPPTIFPPQGEQEEAKAFFLQKNWDLRGIVALHPGAGSRKKAWPAARFAALARALARQSHKILIIAGPADEAAAAEVRAGLRGIPYLLVKDLPITKLAALLSFASLFIGNDSGISHVAAALKRLTIALFGPTDPYVWAPRNDQAFWLQGRAACAPCTRDAQRSCKQQQCLEEIEVEQVMTLIVEKGMTGGGPLAISNRAAFHGRRAIPIEKYDQQYGEEGQSLSPP
jgi:ADP-heptose:LPS heptosyltransferase